MKLKSLTLSTVPASALVTVWIAPLAFILVMLKKRLHGKVPLAADPQPSSQPSVVAVAPLRHIPRPYRSRSEAANCMSTGCSRSPQFAFFVPRCQLLALRGRVSASVFWKQLKLHHLLLSQRGAACFVSGDRPTRLVVVHELAW